MSFQRNWSCLGTAILRQLLWVRCTCPLGRFTPGTKAGQGAAGFFSDQEERSAYSPRMNVHCGSETDRLLQQTSCLVDETSAAAQEKETNSLISGLQNLILWVPGIVTFHLTMPLS